MQRHVEFNIVISTRVLYGIIGYVKSVFIVLGKVSCEITNKTFILDLNRWWQLDMLV